MNIQILYGLKRVADARGTAVAIDLFRACSTACYVFAQGAAAIIPVLDLEQAYRLKREHPDYILMGERQARAQPGFEFGNSPAEIEHVDFSAKTVIHTTACGTKGLVNAGGDEVITASLVNCAAVVEYLRRTVPQTVSLLALGFQDAKLKDEDSLCAEYLQARICGERPDFAALTASLRAHPSAQKFFDPAQPWAPERDLELCLDLDRFNFVLRRESNPAGYFVLRKVLI